MADIRLTDSQKKAIEALAGKLFVAAGAGSGKTGVATRRFVHAIATGFAGIDEILTITFTRKAAAEMMDRVRDYLRHPEKTGIAYDEEQRQRMAAAYRRIEEARISTIDSFCARTLRAHALAAGIDPGFAVADQVQADVLKGEAFELAAEELVREEGVRAVDFMAAYGVSLDGPLYKAITGLYARYAGWGLKPRLPVPEPPDIKAARRRLLEMIDETLAFIEREGAKGKTVNAFIKEVAPAMKATLGEDDPAACLELLEKVKPSASIVAVVKPHIFALQDEREAFINTLASHEALRNGTVVMFSRLLELFADRYADVKESRGVLDFSDTALMLRDLLDSDRSVRERVAGQYRLIMVDEFQDTSRLQHDIIRLVSNDNLMMVGDENQSIYGFRDAEVELFQDEDRRADAGKYRVTLEDNFRSQPEILAFVRKIFSHPEMLASAGYLDLKPVARPDPEPAPFRVELLLVDRDKGDGDPQKRNKDVTEPAEAELIAARLRELIDSGRFSPEDIAILFRNRGGAEVYRDALERRGIRTYFAIGSDYHLKLELRDMVSMLRLLVNPLDDMSLMAVLRSPLAGVNDDTLYHLRQASERMHEKRGEPLWPAVLAAGELEDLADGEREVLSRFRDGFIKLRRLSRRESLPSTVRRILDFNDYAAAMAAGDQGRQALANLQKLTDIAVDFEEAWGRDLARFAAFLSHQKKNEARESDAPMEKEGVEAVRFITMHKAKGLEFPLVVLPRLDKKPGTGRGGKPLVMVDRQQERLGLRCPINGSNYDALDYTELEADPRQLAEEKRLAYVAMTRAERHLIISGTDNLSKLRDDALEKKQPLLWVRHFLAAADDITEASCELPGCERFINQITDELAVNVIHCNDPFALLDSAGRAETITKAVDVRPVSAAVSQPLPVAYFAPPRMSPTALDSYASCPRRYYFENELGAGRLLEIRSHREAKAVPEKLETAVVGALVHALLEVAELPLIGPPDAAAIRKVASEVLDESVEITDADSERVGELVFNLTKSPLAERLVAAHQAGSLYREQDFSMLIGETVVHGKIDALSLFDDSVLVVDYKSAAIRDEDNYGEQAGRYRYQMAAYALAASRLHPGLPVEVSLIFLGSPDILQVKRYEASQAGELGEIMSARIAAMAAGDFPPLDELDHHQCWSCSGGPNKTRLCPVANGGRQ